MFRHLACVAGAALLWITPAFADPFDGASAPTGLRLLADTARLRPVLPGQPTSDRLLRVGAELTFGIAALGPRTGDTDPARAPTAPALSVVLGTGLAARPGTGIELGTAHPLTSLTQHSTRLGVQWHHQDRRVFGGVTWLTDRTDPQTDPSVVGSVTLDIRF